MNPYYFGSRDRRLFGIHEAAQRSSASRGVVLCHPWGPEYIYEPILKDIEKAAELGNLDAEAVRRIRRQIQIETEEAARRREESKE